MTEQRDDDPMAGVRPYIQLASGLLEMSAAKAAELAQGLWTQGGDTVGDAVGDAMGTAMQQGGQVAALLSPDQVRGIVSDEVDRVVRRLGFARADELASLRREVGRLEQQVAALQEQVASTAAKSAGKSGKKSGKKSGEKSGKKDA